MLHIVPISLPSKRKDMEYSVDFKNMVKAHQGKFIGYGNPNANILIIVPKMDDERLDVYNENNSKQWLANIENQTDFDDVVDFFADEGQVGNESTFNPLYPFKGQRDILRKSKDGIIICNDGTSLSWHRIQYFLDEMQWDITDKIDFFKYAFYTLFDEELLKDSFFQQIRYVIYTFLNEKEFARQNPVDLFNMRYWGGQIKPSRAQRIVCYETETRDREMIATISFEKVSKKIQRRLKCSIDYAINRPYSNFGVSDVSYIKRHVDKIASGEISDFDSKKKICSRILKTINGHVAEDPLKWVDTWIYAFHKLKDDSSFMIMNYKHRYHHYISETLALIFVVAPHEVVKEIASYIINVYDEYWFILSSILDCCYIYRKSYIMGRIKKDYISKDTYNALMDAFDEVKSYERKSIIVGKLIWLKYIYRDVYGKKLGY